MLATISVNQPALVALALPLKYNHIAVMCAVDELLDVAPTYYDKMGWWAEVPYPSISNLIPFFGIGWSRCRQIVKELADWGFIEMNPANRHCNTVYMRFGSRPFPFLEGAE